MSYLSKSLQNPNVTPQSKPLAGQIENSAGGHSWEVDCWTRLDRFLILGTEGGSYYANQNTLTAENTGSVIECLKEDGRRTVKRIVEISEAGRAPKNDPAILALALACTPNYADKETRGDACLSIYKVCRTGTHLFMFCDFVNDLRGWGRALREGVALWYSQDNENLAYQLVKYRQRGGWTHRDVLRLAHPITHDPVKKALFDFACGREAAAPMPGVIYGYESAQAGGNAEAFEAIKAHNIPREALKTEQLTDSIVWGALLEKMPMTAMIRNIPTMTRVGLVTPTSAATQTICERLRDPERLKKARIHPIAVLAAMLTYKSGRSARGKAEWRPVTAIVDALDDAFYLSFGNVEPTGKRRMLALDVSSSMSWGEIAGIPGLTPRVASAAMAMIAMKSGDPYEVIGFTGANEFTTLTLSPRQRLDDVVREISNLPFGATDCAGPMLYAGQYKREFDSFEIYTDSETWAGQIHPSQALAAYRKTSGIDAKLAVIGMVSNGFSIADPNDPGMMDVVGFDTATPNIIANFISS